MKILGVDTSSRVLSLGVYDNGKVYEYDVEFARKHSSLLVVAIENVIQALGWELKDLDYLACGLGPGSFTGVRIAVATIKGLAFALKKPIIGASTLDILALNADKDGVIAPVIDAKRNLIYCSIYRRKNGKIKRISPFMLVSIEDFIKKINRNAFLLGDACSLYQADIQKSAKGLVVLDKDYWYPKARNVIKAALEQAKLKKFTDTFKIKPIYLYPKECQINPDFTKTKSAKFVIKGHSANK